MKTRLLAVAIVMALFSGVSRADSCATGSFGSLIGTSCTIGNSLFTFNGGGAGNVSPDALTFTPSAAGAGFNISGLPGTSGQGGEAYFQSFFTVVPAVGTITGFTATVNGIHQDTNTYQVSYADLYDTVNGTGNSNSTYNIYDEYISGNESPLRTGGPEAGFNGFFYLENFSFNGGSTSFDSADFIFNESDPAPPTVPEGSELSMLGITALGIFVAMKKKLQIVRQN